MKYLQGTKDLKLTYRRNTNPFFKGHYDASCGIDELEDKPVIGFIFMLQGGAITWMSKKQEKSTKSIAEAEHYAIASTTKEAIWLSPFTRELQIQNNNISISIFCDNQIQSYINFSEKCNYTPLTRHITINTFWSKMP